MEAGGLLPDGSKRSTGAVQRRVKKLASVLEPTGTHRQELVPEPGQTSISLQTHRPRRDPSSPRDALPPSTLEESIFWTSSSQSDLKEPPLLFVEAYSPQPGFGPASVHTCSPTNEQTSGNRGRREGAALKPGPGLEFKRAKRFSQYSSVVYRSRRRGERRSDRGAGSIECIPSPRTDSFYRRAQLAQTLYARQHSRLMWSLTA